MKEVKIFVLGLLIIIGAILVSAEVSYFGNTLSTSYGGGENIKGKVNLSFDEQPADSLFTSNFNGSITLKDLLEANGFTSGNQYNCSSADCGSEFILDNEITSKEIEDGKGFVGFKIDGSFVDLTDFNIRLQSNAGPSCFPQIRVDVLDNNEDIITNKRYTTNTCFDRKYGCFETGLSSYQTATIPYTGGQYCETVTLPAGPAFRLGAVVTNSTQGSATLTMELYDIEGDLLGECNLPSHSQGTQELGCIAEYSSSAQGDYFVCINANGNSNYKIRTETNDVCGTSNFGESYGVDYEIFAENMQFGSVDFSINEDSYDDLFNNDLIGMLRDYVFDKYNSDCSNGCAIPIGIYGEDQTVSFSNAEIVYEIDGAEGITSNDVYDAEKESAKISSDALSVELSHANFVIPLGSNEKYFELFLGGEKVFEQNVSIAESFDFEVVPQFVGFGENTLFVVLSDEEISSVEWDFGDGNIETSQGNSIRYRYLKGGQFTLEVEATSVSGITSRRSFTVFVGNAQDIANSTIADYRNRLNSMDIQFNKFQPWVADELRKKINVLELGGALDSIESQFNEASSDAAYQSVVLKLVDLKIPKSIDVTLSGNFPLILGYNNIDTGYIEEISGRTVEDQETLINRIASWTSENTDAMIGLEVISGIYDSEREPILTKFDVNIAPKAGLPSPSYFVLNFDIVQINFRQDYNARSVSDGTYVVVDSTDRVEFTLPGSISVQELAAYISPEIQRLGEIDLDLLECNFNGKCESVFGENSDNCRADCKPWGLFVFWIAVLLFVALIIYIAMQEWYKRFYEKHLFKKREYLYNLVNFIYSARTKGLSPSDIKSKLKEAGWSREQISYGFKKLDGRRTGLYEIPVFKVFENKKVMKELEKRQGGQVDARFIKRPDLGV